MNERLDGLTVNVLRSNLGKALENKLCSDFINGVINNLKDKIVNGQEAKKFSGTIGENFERINSAGGFWKGNINLRGLYVGLKITFGNRYFSPAGSDAIKYGIDENNLSELGPKASGRGYEVYELTKGLDTTLTLVHELVHGYYERGFAASHDEMAIAAKASLQQLGNHGKMPPISKPSQYFDAALVKACGKVKL